jgi:hypothetical protein
LAGVGTVLCLMIPIVTLLIWGAVSPRSQWQRLVAWRYRHPEANEPSDSAYMAAGWPAQRAARVAEIIVLHMRDDVSPAANPEAHLLQVATSWEVVGRRPEEFPPDARAEMLARYPRLEFGAEFLGYFEDQASRKPRNAAAASVRINVAARIAANPLEGQPPA